mmetsp:Transcript_80208/g.98250  ORF Transcript_80208/g.98250 Transcript_80208/m.98250 type:complete len:303 (-) Transcript_80208:481-1389(-)
MLSTNIEPGDASWFHRAMQILGASQELHPQDAAGCSLHQPGGAQVFVWTQDGTQGVRGRVLRSNVLACLSIYKDSELQGSSLWHRNVLEVQSRHITFLHPIHIPLVVIASGGIELCWIILDLLLLETHGLFTRQRILFQHDFVGVAHAGFVVQPSIVPECGIGGAVRDDRWSGSHDLLKEDLPEIHVGLRLLTPEDGMTVGSTHTKGGHLTMALRIFVSCVFGGVHGIKGGMVQVRIQRLHVLRWQSHGMHHHQNAFVHGNGRCTALQVTQVGLAAGDQQWFLSWLLNLNLSNGTHFNGVSQ